MTPEPRYLRAYRLGQALLRLIEAKAECGQDFYASSSWCSDSTGIVVIVRRAGAKLGQPVFDVCPVRAMERAAG